MKNPFDEEKFIKENEDKNNSQKIIEEENYSQSIKIGICKNDITNKDKLIKLIEKINPKFLEIYEIKEYIGSGSESVVYKVIHKKINKVLEIKFLLNEGKRNITEFNILHKL